MQKKIIALAIAGLASTTAFAQTNVTIYGVIDTTFDVVQRSSSNDVVMTGAAAVFPATTTASAADNDYRFKRVSFNSSYLGFKGTEALGNGLSAIFQLEMGVSPDAGAALSLSRDSYGGITGGFGTIVLGQLTGPTRALGAAVDVNAGATGIGANSGLIGKFGNHLTNFVGDGVSGNYAPSAATRSQVQNSIFDTRWKNAIAYVSPNFSGLTATAAYVANENKADNVVDTSGYDIGLNYANGPAMAGITYNDVRVRNAAAASDGSATAARAVTYGGVPVSALGTRIRATDLRVGGSFDFKVVKVAALYDRVKFKNEQGADEAQNVWGIGATVPIGNGRIIGQFYKANDISHTSDTGAKLWEIGYVHSLSKRTEVRAVYARLSNDDAVNYDFGVNAVGNGASAAVGAGGAVTTVGMGSTVSGVQVGLRHSF